MVFHDDTMKRMCGNEGKISDYTYEELQQFHLGDSTEKIPLLREVLQTVDGRVPLLIEIKMPGLSTAVCAGFQKEMEGYTGMFCMESFNSLALRWCRRHMPQTLRGQLSGRFSKDNGASSDAEFYRETGFYRLRPPLCRLPGLPDRPYAVSDTGICMDGKR